MVNSKTTICQVQQFHHLLHDNYVKGKFMSECFQTVTTIKKSLLSWKDLKNYLKYKHKKMRVENVILRLRIEEHNKLFKYNFKKVSKSNNFMLSKNRMIVVERYLTDNLFKIFIMTILTKDEMNSNKNGFFPTNLSLVIYNMTGYDM